MIRPHCLNFAKLLFTALSLAMPLVGAADARAGELTVSPREVALDRPEASQQLLVRATAGGQRLDATRQARYEVAPAGVVSVNERGLVRALAEGTAEIIVHHGEAVARASVVVSGLQAPTAASFRYEVLPVLSKAGCNSGACHGKAEGQNGFKLSIFGFDAAADHRALAVESRGRRVFPASPQRSLVLMKGSARQPHGGGQRVEPGGPWDRLLLRWIAEGAKLDAADQSGRIVRLEIEPQHEVLLAGQSQQLRVTAVDAAGRRRCVTADSQYESNAASIAEVDSHGLVQASDIPGEAAILVRYLEHVAVCRLTLPQPGVKFARPSEHNFIDGHVWDKLQRLGIEPSALSGDAEFMRRVYLDCIGTLPTPAEARRFMADDAADKRSRLIDHLLSRDEYADYWTMRWLDILRADQLAITPQGAVAMQRWLHRSIAENQPFDQLVGELLTVQGPTAAEGPAAFYKILNKPDAAARSISQLFLGVRIECAQCHHHPSERWSQADYVALAGFFTGVSLKKMPQAPTQQSVISRGGKDLPHPRTGELVPAHALGAPPADFRGVLDRRRVLAAWMTSPDNPFFAKALANRLWAHYLGRGLIEPIDDIRDTNPASNEPLMKALAQHLVDVRFDTRAFTRTLLNSRAYQLSSAARPSNENDLQNFSRAAYKSIPAEVLLDAICQATGVAEKFNGWPEGYRAIQVWDNRMPSYFFRIFGRPVRASVCECERSEEPSIAQALHLLNAPEIAEKIGHRRGRARQLADSELAPPALIDELFLTTLSRFPQPPERALMLEAFNDLDRRAAAEDVLWTLLNTKEFIFNH